jgi:hypothetical protein
MHTYRTCILILHSSPLPGAQQWQGSQSRLTASDTSSEHNTCESKALGKVLFKGATRDHASLRHRSFSVACWARATAAQAEEGSPGDKHEISGHVCMYVVVR